MSKTYDVYFKFVEPFSVLVEANSPSEALEVFYMQFDKDDLIAMLVGQGFQDAQIDTVLVVDAESGDEFPVDPLDE